MLPAEAESDRGWTADAPFPEVSAYACSKAAILRLTDTLAAETAADGIHVFALAPGFVAETEMGQSGLELFEALAREGKYGTDASHVPRSRSPEQAAALTVLIASGKADALSGRLMSVHYDTAEVLGRVKEIREKDLYTLWLRV